MTEPCPCCSGAAFAACCAPYLAGAAHAPTAEALMRSRYTAFARHDIDYLVRTHEHPAPSALSNELAASIGRQRWLRLSVIETKQGGERDKTGFVSFIATYIDRGAICELRERSEFRRRKGRWRYLKACKESPHRVEN